MPFRSESLPVSKGSLIPGPRFCFRSHTRDGWQECRLLSQGPECHRSSSWDTCPDYSSAIRRVGAATRFGSDEHCGARDLLVRVVDDESSFVQQPLRPDADARIEHITVVLVKKGSRLHPTAHRRLRLLTRGHRNCGAQARCKESQTGPVIEQGSRSSHTEARVMPR